MYSVLHACEYIVIVVILNCSLRVLSHHITQSFLSLFPFPPFPPLLPSFPLPPPSLSLTQSLQRNVLWKRVKTLWVNVGGLEAALFILQRSSMPFSQRHS